MMKDWFWLGVVVVGLMVIFGDGGACSSSNDETARTARVAVENSREAMRQNDAAYIWPGRLRLLAIALGVTVPIAAAVVLAGLSFRHRPEELEVLALARKEEKRLGVKNKVGLIQAADAGKSRDIVPAQRTTEITPK